MNKYFFVIVIMFVIGAGGCVPHDEINPIDYFDTVMQNNIIGKWQLVGKSIDPYDYTDAVEEEKYIEFTKIENSIYGNFISNIAPEYLYYLVCNRQSINCIYFYNSLNNEFNYFCWLELNDNDTLILSFGAGWFNNEKSEYKYFYFKKMEDE